MTTIKEVAQLANVSIATVSKIKNGNDLHISSATREKVKRIMKETNYVPNAVAKGLKQKRTKTLGFVLPDIRNPFFPEIARGIEDAAVEREFSVTFCNTDNNSKRQADALDFLQSKMVDGVVVTRSMFGGSGDTFAKYNFPIVVVDRKSVSDEQKVGEIVIDTQSAFYDITKLLLEEGCRKVAFISAIGQGDDKRYIGFAKALGDAGLKVDERLVYRANYDVETGYEGVKKVFSQGRPDSIVCGNDLIAVGAMGALREMGISIPEEIKVTGFDDIYFSRYLNPSLTTIKQPAYEMGVEAATMLMDYITEGKPLSMKKLEYQLVVRESTSRGGRKSK